MQSTILYLGQDVIRELALTPGDIRAALGHGFGRHAAGGFKVQPKQSLILGPGHFFQSLSAISDSPAHAGTKWIGVAAANAGRGLANVNGLILLDDAETGMPLAVMDAGLLTVARTAGMSALAATFLARPDSRSIGFVGAGMQARGHLPALLDVLPALDTVVVHSARSESAEAFAAWAAQQRPAARTAARATRNADEVLDCDVIVTTVAGGPDLAPFLDGGKVRAGAFVSAVDLGRSWLPPSLDGFDLKITDDLTQSSDPANRRKLSYQGPFDADLAGLTTSAAAHRSDRDQRALFLFPGFAIADLIIAGLAYREALARGLGIRLPR